MRERARQEFQRVIAIDPTFGDAYYNLAYLYVTDSPPQLARARNFYLEAQKNGTAADAAMDRKLGTWRLNLPIHFNLYILQKNPLEESL